MQLDLEKFFVTINRPLLCNLLLKHCQHETYRKLIVAIYGHDARKKVQRIGDPQSFRLIPHGKSWFEQATDQGIPIGNLTSQFGANVYLTHLDHFIQREIKPKAYLRYMDDLLLVDSDPEKIRNKTEVINQWLLKNRNQNLNANKSIFANLSDGISYLGYRLRYTDSPQEPLQVFPEPIKKWQFISAVRKLRSVGNPKPYRPNQLAPLIRETKIAREMASVNSRIGILIHSRSFLLRKQTLERFVWESTLNNSLPADFASHWCTFLIKKGYRSIKLR